MATLRLHGPLKKLAGGEHALDGATVGELLEEIEQQRPELAGWILDERRCIRRHINVYVNGDLAAADTAVRAPDRVEVLPAISGG
jgi:molybdopterin synthase sulfur carrier subunit